MSEPKVKIMMNGIPRRAQMDLWTPAEKAIYDALQAVEAMPADVRLTDAVVLLGAARNSVADYVEDVQQRRYVRVAAIAAALRRQSAEATRLREALEDIAEPLLKLEADARRCRLPRAPEPTHE